MTTESSRPTVLDQLRMPDEVRDEMLALIRSAGGAVWTRPGLPAAQRSMVTVAILAALGREEPLRIHIGLGLDNGLSRLEICEVLMHTAVYAGFPATVTALRAGVRGVRRTGVTSGGRVAPVGPGPRHRTVRAAGRAPGPRPG